MATAAQGAVPAAGTALARLSPGTTNPPACPNPLLCPWMGTGNPRPTGSSGGWQTHLGLGGNVSGESEAHYRGIFTFPQSQSIKPHTNQLGTQQRAAMASSVLQLRDGDAGLNVPGGHEASQLNSLMLDWRSAGRQKGRGERSEGEDFVQKTPFLEGRRDISW